MAASNWLDVEERVRGWSAEARKEIMRAVEKAPVEIPGERSRFVRNLAVGYSRLCQPQDVDSRSNKSQYG